MRQVALRQKSQIARMRSTQRKAQRELEETIADIEEKPLQFCMLCRLNYRTSKDEHQLSEAHVNMKKFLLPYCKICRISFKSPMVYETHRCSLEHIKVRFYFSYSHFRSNFVHFHNSARHVLTQMRMKTKMQERLKMKVDYQWIWTNS